jgi:hypothetical protein
VVTMSCWQNMPAESTSLADAVPLNHAIEVRSTGAALSHQCVQSIQKAIGFRLIEPLEECT